IEAAARQDPNVGALWQRILNEQGRGRILVQQEDHGGYVIVMRQARQASAMATHDLANEPPLPIVMLVNDAKEVGRWIRSADNGAELILYEGFTRAEEVAKRYNRFAEIWSLLKSE